MESLIDHVKTLPNEVQAMIRAFVFTSSSAIRRIHTAYKPASCGQVSRSTRERYLTSYYASDAIFLIDKPKLAHWLASLDTPSRGLVRKCILRLNVAKITVDSLSLLELTDILHSVHLWGLHFDMLARHAPFSPEWLNRKLEFCVLYGSEDKEYWTTIEEIHDFEDNIEWPLRKADQSALAWLLARDSGEFITGELFKDILRSLGPGSL